jgi:hypothetical protein
MLSFHPDSSELMKQSILQNLQQPLELEKLYRLDKNRFKAAFNELYPQLPDRTMADCWHVRLNYEKELPVKDPNRQWVTVIILSLIAGLVARLPDIFPIGESFFYQRNIGFIIFPVLAAWFAWIGKLSKRKLFIAAGSMLAGIVLINLLPDNRSSDTLRLSCIHLPLFLWAVLGFVFTGEEWNLSDRRIDFLKYNGDLVVMTALILIAGAILTAITIGLFSLIGMRIEQFYMENIGVMGLAAAPVIATYLIDRNPELVNRVSPVIARIFSPLVLITLIAYLIALVISHKDPYNDREFLLVFNALLIGVIAILFFAVAETTGQSYSQVGTAILFLLSGVMVIVNGIALSAIIYRVFLYGITPNRLAVLGSNILFLANLALVSYRLSGVLRHRSGIEEVERSIAAFLPVYSLWSVLVTVGFPFLFGFR